SVVPSGWFPSRRTERRPRIPSAPYLTEISPSSSAKRLHRCHRDRAGIRWRPTRQYLAWDEMTSRATIGDPAAMGGDRATNAVARQLGALFEGGPAAGLSDRQLLERFVADRGAAGEAAFAAMVARHGPMVLGVCRQLLDDRHHAEDAFQATFLVLA